MKKCMQCNTLNDDKANFCNACGAKLENNQDVENKFLLPIEEVYYVSGKGTVILGEVAVGEIAVNGTAYLVFEDGRTIKTTVIGIEASQKLLIQASRGANVGVILKDVSKEDAANALALAGQSQNLLHTSFTAKIHLSENRPTPIFNHYYPWFVFGKPNTKIESRGSVCFSDEKTEMLMPNNDEEVTIKLDKPCILVNDLSFGFHEGGSMFTGYGKINSFAVPSDNVVVPAVELQEEQEIIRKINKFIEDSIEQVSIDLQFDTATKEYMVKKDTEEFMNTVFRHAVKELSADQAEQLHEFVNCSDIPRDIIGIIIEYGIDVNKVVADVMDLFRASYADAVKNG